MSLLGSFMIAVLALIACSGNAAFAQLGGDAAQELDSASNEALHQTKTLLLDPTKRAEVIKNDPNSAKADANLKAVAGAYSDDMYKLAASIFESMAKESKGDSLTMTQILEKAQKDPGSLHLTPEQEAQLKDLAGKVQAPPKAPQ